MNFSILESEGFIEETRRALERLSEGSADAVSWENFKHAPEAAEEEERSPGAFGDDIKYCREQLLTVLEERYRGAQVRSRTDVLEGLFRKEVVDTDAFEPLLRGSSSVPEEAIDVISCPIRESEVRDAIGKLSRNKAPGPDGIGAEFYKAFSDTLCPILTEVFADTKKRGLLPPTMRQSRTVLIPKKSGGGSVPESEGSAQTSSWVGFPMIWRRANDVHGSLWFRAIGRVCFDAAQQHPGAPGRTPACGGNPSNAVQKPGSRFSWGAAYPGTSAASGGDQSLVLQKPGSYPRSSRRAEGLTVVSSSLFKPRNHQEAPLWARDCPLRRRRFDAIATWRQQRTMRWEGTRWVPTNFISRQVRPRTSQKVNSHCARDLCAFAVTA
ncbi:hypothetical protein ISCGN_024081 [Ixodes scapularis]